MDQSIGGTTGLDKRQVRANLAVIGSTFAIFLPGSLVFGFPGLMGSVWRDMLQIQSGALSYVMFFMLASLGIFMFFVGKWTATIGVRKLMMIGTVMTSLATLMIAFVANIWMIYLWAFMIGGASCFIYSPGINSVQRWFPEKRGLVSGIVNLTFGISAAIMVPIFRIMLDVIGYQTLCILMAILTLIVGLIASQYTEIPEKVKGMQVSDNKAVKISNMNDQNDFSPKEAMKTRSFWLIWSVWALMGAAGVTMVTLSVNLGLSRGFNLTAAATILTAYNITNGVSRLVSGAISDVIGRKVTLAITFIGAGIAYVLLPHASSLVMISLLAAMIGFGYGTLFSCSAPMISDCFGLKNFGIILGLVFTAYGFIASIIGPAVSGYILTITDGNYQIVFNYLAVFCLVSAILIMLVKTPIKENGKMA
ncbi:MFS transporter [Alkaliphilus peptidifermentans]|uniref:MFS transporter, OFA family, oxalate/formate antiporter n=1 Tax=Alkaliphilus peptidifermentans DSM 18978 TaxID=1120976 RepID=A0A1G5K853_9FIRM|nr:MFS transporter [Alkaliphilus peptidifermentans]SCY96431.1 MFS transporter, OFA family, oxalate/formate antiporter [Alkaliphilus peptidifermentans DSM 18978]